MRSHINIFLLLFFFSTPVYIKPLLNDIDVPEWIGQADNILEAVEIFYGEVQADEKVYQDWHYTLENKLYELDQVEQKAEEFFGAMREKFNQLQRDIENNQLITQDKDTVVGDLESQMQVLKNESEQELARLNNIIADVNIELEATHQSYAYFRNVSEDKAHKLIDALVALKDKYNHMIQNRADFLSTLDTFVARTQEHCTHQNEKMGEFGSTPQSEQEAKSSAQVENYQPTSEEVDVLYDSTADLLSDSLADSLPDTIE